MFSTNNLRRSLYARGIPYRASDNLEDVWTRFEIEELRIMVIEYKDDVSIEIRAPKDVYSSKAVYIASSIMDAASCDNMSDARASSCFRE